MIILAISILCLVGSVAATETGSDDTSVTCESNSDATTTTSSSHSTETSQSTPSTTSSESSTHTTTSSQTTNSSLYSSSSSNTNKVSTSIESSTSKTLSESTQTSDNTETSSTQQTSTLESTTTKSVVSDRTSEDNSDITNYGVSTLSDTSGSDITTISTTTTSGENLGDSVTLELNDINANSQSVTDNIDLTCTVSTDTTSIVIDDTTESEVTENIESYLLTGTVTEDNALTTNIKITDMTVEPGETVIFNALLTTDNGSNIESGKVAFKVNGNTVGIVDVKDGQASLEYTIPYNWINPTYTLMAVYGSSTEYETSSNNSVISLYSYTKTDIEVTNITATAGDKITLTAKVTTDDNKNVNYGKVAFKINNITVGYANVTNGTAQLVYQIPSTWTDSKYDISVVYGETGVYKAASESGILTLNQNNLKTASATSTKVSVTSFSANAGSTVTINATVKTTGGSNVKSGKVAFKINGNTIGYSNVSNGKVSYKYKIPLTWTDQSYTITVVYGGNSDYQKSTGTGKLSLKDISSTTTLSNITSNAGKTITLQAKITASNNATVNGGKVSFKINGKTIGTVKVSNGVAKLSYTIPSSYSNPTYSITAVYGGSGALKSSTKTATLTLNNVVKTSVKVTGISDYSGNTVTFKATLYAKNGSYVKNGTVAFKLNGVTIGHANVSNGGAKLVYQIPSNYSSKSYTITVVYGQNGIYKSSTGTGTLKILPKVSTKVTVTDISSSSGSTITLKATITTSNGSYAKDGLVAFKINGNTIGYANVSNGGAKLNFTIPSSYKDTKYTITATYGSSNKYLDSRANGTLTLKASSSSSMSKYLKETKNCQVSSSTIQNIASKFTGYSSTYSKAKAIFNYLNDKTSYSGYSNTRYGAVSTWNRKAGNCCDLTHLLVAVYRACGIPARYCHAKCTFNSGSVIGHVWAEVYVDGTWYKCDLTSASNSFGKINNWYKSTTVTRYAELPF